MDNTFLTFAIIKSLYEEKKDYLDVFVPFLLISFPKGQKECDKNILYENIKTETGLIVPAYTLETVITRSVRSDYLTQKKDKCTLTEKGSKFILQILSKQKDTQREINALVEDIKIFVKDKYQVSLDSRRISDILNSFIKKHQIPLTSFFNPVTAEEISQLNPIKDEIYLIEYFKIAGKEKPQSFSTLKNLFYGAIISTLLYKENITEINKKFGKIEIFFDTNFMFSVMGLHYSYICKPAKELFKILKDYRFQLKVFDFTINEMIRVLKGYQVEQHKYFPNVKIDSIYSNLRNQGWTHQDCLRFISNIEKRIYDIGIEIEYTHIDLNRYEVNDKNYKISQYKPDQTSLGQKHDICAIEKIKKIRKKTQREIENCIALFLTSDLKLARYNFLEMGHKDNFTVCEVFSDRFLTTLLWLKNPAVVKEIPLEMIISIHSELLISRDVWHRFYENLDKLKRDGKVSVEDIATLFYYNQLESELATVKAEDITSDFVIQEIEKGRKKIDEKIDDEIKKKIEEQKKIFELKLMEERTKKEEEYFIRINKIKDVLWQVCDKRSKKYSYSIWFIITLIIVGLILYSLYLINIGILTAAIVSFIEILCSILGIKFNLLKLRKKLYDFLFSKFHKNMLYKLHIEESNG